MLQSSSEKGSCKTFLLGVAYDQGPRSEGHSDLGPWLEQTSPRELLGSRSTAEEDSKVSIVV